MLSGMSILQRDECLGPGGLKRISDMETEWEGRNMNLLQQRASSRANEHLTGVLVHLIPMWEVGVWVSHLLIGYIYLQSYILRERGVRATSSPVGVGGEIYCSGEDWNPLIVTTWGMEGRDKGLFFPFLGIPWPSFGFICSFCPGIPHSLSYLLGKFFGLLILCSCLINCLPISFLRHLKLQAAVAVYLVMSTSCNPYLSVP